VSLRVIADHVRATAFLISNGVYPSNEWRGYVLRRIMRRAMRHGRLLGFVKPFLWAMTETVVDVMGDVYPELREHRARIAETIRLEEERFAGILDTGVSKIREYMEERVGSVGRTAEGKFLFTLYDTHGFPLDLAQEVFREAGWQVTEESLHSFETEMEAQRARARASAGFGGEADETTVIYRELVTQLPTVEFIGYETLSAPARILAMVAGRHRAMEVVAGDEVEVILDRTPCYAESGGQIGDTGRLVGREGQGEILDTYFRGTGLIVHRVRASRGGFREGEEVAVSVESPRRQGLRLHHTGTHLLHAALRKVLGSHATQAGSLVAPDRLRFDFTNPGQVKDRDLERIEALVNEKVEENLHVDPFWTELEQALKFGALALFGEKYGQRVRVVRIGDFSAELCGGTHLNATGQIGLFKIVSEGAVAAGIRRIEAVSGPAALAYVNAEESALRKAADLLKIPPLELPGRLAKLLEDQKILSKELADLEFRLARARVQEIVAGARQVGDVTVVAARLDDLDFDGLRTITDSLRERLGSGVVCLGSVTNGKVSLVAAVTKDLIPRFNAGKLIEEVARVVGGGGGGRPDLAQAGGKDPSKLEQALSLVYDWVGRTFQG
jgi:alanyl-tRNA synthetase